MIASNFYRYLMRVLAPLLLLSGVLLVASVANLFLLVLIPKATIRAPFTGVCCMAFGAMCTVNIYFNMLM
jgi:hypothetical protein